jgi:hypothetical protein
MRATATGLAALAVLGLAGSVVHAQPCLGRPQCPPCNPFFYNAGACGCWYGPNYCFQGACLPPAPFNGMLPVPKGAAAYAQAAGLQQAGGLPPGMAPPGGVPGQPGVGPHPGAPGVAGVPGVPGAPSYLPPPVPGPAGFPWSPFVRSPRDFFMYGQEHND